MCKEAYQGVGLYWNKSDHGLLGLWNWFMRRIGDLSNSRLKKPLNIVSIAYGGGWGWGWGCTKEWRDQNARKNVNTGSLAQQVSEAR